MAAKLWVSETRLRMDDLIKKLTPEQAFEVALRLSQEEGAVRDAVLAEARNVLCDVDPEDIADNVFFVLDSVDVQDCWDRAGSSRGGYTSPDEAAVELIDEELQPFFNQIGRYHELGLTEEEATYCKGVILGVYRYEHESKSEFRQWAVDIPIECAGALLAKWRKRGQKPASLAAMDEFIRQRCPKWAGSLLRTGMQS